MSIRQLLVQGLDIFRGPAVPGMPEAQIYGEVLLKAFGSMGLRDYAGNPAPHTSPIGTPRQRAVP